MSAPVPPRPTTRDDRDLPDGRAVAFIPGESASRPRWRGDTDPPPALRLADEQPAAPPKLPGEVWRGQAGQLGLCAVAPDPFVIVASPALRAWRWVPDAKEIPVVSRWRARIASISEEAAAVFRAWAEHERAVVAGEKRLLVAMQNLAEALEDIIEAESSGDDDIAAIAQGDADAAHAECDVARTALAALGVDVDSGTEHL